jgi:mRNA interferase RelE/StbE
MNVVLDKLAAKSIECINEPMLGRLLSALVGLAKKPPQGDIKKLSGRDDFRLRVGKYRVLFRIEDNVIIVTNIAPRGQAYKE